MKLIGGRRTFLPPCPDIEIDLKRRKTIYNDRVEEGQRRNSKEGLLSLETRNEKKLQADEQSVTLSFSAGG